MSPGGGFMPPGKRGRVPLRKSRVPHSFAFFANEWAIAPNRLLILAEDLDRTASNLQWPLLKSHPHRPGLAVLVRSKAAPQPSVGLLDQPAAHRIQMHVMDFLDSLSRAPDVEIIETFLPHRFMVAGAGAQLIRALCE